MVALQTCLAADLFRSCDIVCVLIPGVTISVSELQVFRTLYALKRNPKGLLAMHVGESDSKTLTHRGSSELHVTSDEMNQSVGSCRSETPYLVFLVCSEESQIAAYFATTFRRSMQACGLCAPDDGQTSIRNDRVSSKSTRYLFRTAQVAFHCVMQTDFDGICGYLDRIRQTFLQAAGRYEESIQRYASLTFRWKA